MLVLLKNKMKIKEMQKKYLKVIEDYNKKHNLKHDPSTSFHHLIEEVGGLAREISKENNDWEQR